MPLSCVLRSCSGVQKGNRHSACRSQRCNFAPRGGNKSLSQDTDVVPALFALDALLTADCRSAVQKEEIRRLEQRCSEADLHSGMLAQRLARSDQLRMDQVRAIEQLRHELVDMQSKLPSRRGTSTAPLTARKSSGHPHSRDVNGGVHFA